MYRVNMTFEGSWLLSTGQFTIQTSWGHKILMYEGNWLLSIGHFAIKKTTWGNKNTDLYRQVGA